MKIEGPKIRIDASCSECRHEHSESYAVQGDSGHTVYCTHPLSACQAGAKDGRKVIGDTTWQTPKWCPLLQGAIREFLNP